MWVRSNGCEATSHDVEAKSDGVEAHVTAWRQISMALDQIIVASQVINILAVSPHVLVRKPK